LEGSGRILILRYYTGIRLEGLRKSTRILSQDSRSSVRKLNPGPIQYEAGVLITRPGHVAQTSPLEYFATWEAISKEHLCTVPT
jgi:hypothetical protein